jgi:hypothetical protein
VRAGAWVGLPTAVAPLDARPRRMVTYRGARAGPLRRIVYDGFLYPFGHRASLVKVTEREVRAPDPTIVNSPAAYMRQRMFIGVEREKTYAGLPYTFSGREMPLLQKVRIKTRVTPEIDPPSFIGTASFWVDVGPGIFFPFHLSGVNLAGKTAAV